MFHVKVSENKKLDVTDDFAANLYAMTDDEKASFLNGKVGPNTIVMCVHCLASWLGCYLSGSTTVVMAGESAARAIAEWKLALLLVAQDNDSSHYTQEEGAGFVHDSSEATCTMRIPGIAMSQLDERNQKVLKDCAVVLNGVTATGNAQHDKTLTVDGYHATKQGAFFATPLYLGGWP